MAAGVARRKSRYLQSLAKHLDPVKACAFARIDRTTVWLWKTNDQEFAQKLELLTEFSTENVEGAVYRRAMKMSAADARTWLQAHKRELYGDRVDINVLIRNDPKIKSVMIGIGQILEEFVVKEKLPSAIARLRLLAGIFNGDTGLSRPEQPAITDARVTEESAGT